VARFVSFADESGDRLFLFYESVNRNKKGNIITLLAGSEQVINVALWGFKMGISPLHT